MTEKKDTAKDIAVGVGATALIAVHAPALIAAAAGTLIAVSWNHITHGAERRAKKMLETMIEGTGEPEAFANSITERIKAEDDETLSAFRTLIDAAVKAVSPDALAAMGFIGRCYFQGLCDLRMARQTVELLNHLTGAELRELRTLASQLASVKCERLCAVSDIPNKESGERRGWMAWPIGKPDDPTKVELTPLTHPTDIFGYLKRCNIGSDTGAYGLGGSPRAIELPFAAVVLLRDALVATVKN